MSLLDRLVDQLEGTDKGLGFVWFCSTVTLAVGIYVLSTGDNDFNGRHFRAIAKFVGPDWLGGILIGTAVFLFVIGVVRLKAREDSRDAE